MSWVDERVALLSEGGWWTRPSNWVSNTAVASLGLIAATVVVWKFSASLEVCPFFLLFMRDGIDERILSL